MRIVIDIPDAPIEDYHDLYSKIYGMAASEGLFDDKVKSQRALALKVVLEVLNGIVNGTPLPDGAEILTKEAYSDLCTRAADVSNTNDGDVISRQAAKLKVARVTWKDGDSCYDFHDRCVDCLDDVPPAQPERKTGIWTHEDTCVWTCGVCGEEVGEMGDEYGVPKYNFCPYCGADMTGRRVRNDR